MTRSQRSGDGERILAVFIDFENLGLGFGARRDRFSIEKVLERLVEKGKIVAKKAYADWSRFGQYAGMLHAAAVELVEIPKRSQTGKNSADIRMCVDAMDLAYSKDHIDTFVVVSGDSDFSPLVSKLKELGKHVIGLGLVDSTSDLLRDNCDEFIYYEDLDRAPNMPLVENQAIPETKRKAFTLLLDSLLALRRENKDVIYSSMLKDTMKRKKPSFNEEYHGYRSFTELLEDAQRHGFIEIERHKNSGTFIITQAGMENRGAAAALPSRPVAPPKPLALPPKPAAVPARQPSTPARPQPAAGPKAPAPAEARGGTRRGTASRRPAEAPARLPAPQERPPRENLAEDEDRLPLGRALIEDVLDEEPGDLELPSYMPRKAEPPAAKPAKPAAPARPAKAAKPATAPRTTAPRAKAEPKPAAQPGRRAEPSRTARKPEPPPAKPVSPPAKPVPPPPTDEDAEFGAGLDL